MGSESAWRPVSEVTLPPVANWPLPASSSASAGVLPLSDQPSGQRASANRRLRPAARARDPQQPMHECVDLLNDRTDHNR